MSEKEASTLSMVMTLGVFGLLSGLLLVGTYLFTLPYIEANQEEALRKAIFLVLPGCRKYETLVLEGEKLVVSSDPKKDKKKPRVFLGRDAQGRLVGFAISGKVAGFQDEIRGIFGYQPYEKVVVGFQVLESRETPGLGDKIAKDETFLANFRKLAVEPKIVTVKKGKKTRENEVEAITGATISSKAVVKLLNRALAFWRPKIEAYLKEAK